ncbi:MAG TPA: 16S rRNA (uracil(1498)-N(3))-methyltransferase [Stenotrophobium sp.]|jgi:16S rRNA (uracil1498-N3)-methyltransferase|nr:16S rRNA (uracil(1498)-N(3))-methyltransferase [Stenotrophobium sp.]
MANPRIYIDLPLTEGAHIDLPEGPAHHLLQVLRLKVGEDFTLFNGKGGEYEAVITKIGRRNAQAWLVRYQEPQRESPLKVTLAQCVSKGERMDYTLQKAVELGVNGFVPLLSSRSVVKLNAERWDKKMEHWRGVITSACEQSGRTCVPQLEEVASLEDWLLQRHADELRLTLAPGAALSLPSLQAPQRPVILLVGPEGGLSGAEMLGAQTAGFIPLGLGPRILRTETAGIAVLAAMQALWGDWSI